MAGTETVAATAAKVQVGVASPAALLASKLRPGRPVRVLVVDDSAVMRRMLTRMLSAEASIEVVGTAVNGRDALVRVEQYKPDLVTLDVEMPELDGLGALRLIQARFPAVRVIMCSSLTQRGAAVTIDALLSGASDYVCKQHSAGLTEDAFASLQQELLRKIRHLFPAERGFSGPQPPASGPVTATTAPQPLPGIHADRPSAGLRAAPKVAPRVLVIGVSTGGPSALAEILPMIPKSFPLPIAIVQHMPPFFTQLLADRLTRVATIKVMEARTGMEMVPGLALLAPGDFHMRLVRQGPKVVIDLNQQAPENSCRPAVDVLFRSAYEVYGGAAIALVLTGMGQDGLEGVKPLRAHGASVLVQDSATSVVWGMPGAIAAASLADAVLPLKEIIPEVLRRV